MRSAPPWHLRREAGGAGGVLSHRRELGRARRGFRAMVPGPAGRGSNQVIFILFFF
eukprot:SAG31_NODE_4278_length_3384_cov_1.471537_3_plen_56_part_00